MSDPSNGAVRGAISAVLAELLDGAAPDSGWLLNPKDAGLLRSLDSLSAAEASLPARDGGASIAAHVEHLRYGLSLLSRWSDGEESFDDADWSASWRRQTVSEAEWEALRAELRHEAGRWQSGFSSLFRLGERGITGVIASAAHLAYHLGAIRQINAATRGPREQG